MSLLLHVWKNTPSLLRRDETKAQIKRNLTRFKADRYQYLSMGNYFRFIRNYKNLGVQVGEAIRNQDLSLIVECANSSVRTQHDWMDFIEEKFDNADEVFRCHDCEAIELRDNENCCYDDYYVCGSCVDNYTFCDDRQTYVREEDLNRSIGDYHSSRGQLGRIPSAYDQRKPRVLLGLELEVEVPNDDRYEVADRLLAGVGKYKSYQYALCEEDGSLDDGFEMVTAYTGLDVHREQLSYFRDQRLKGARSHETSTCGLHVHICKADMTTLHGAKMILFINDEANQKLIHAVARRESNYGSIKNKKDSKDWIANALEADTKKYQLMHLNEDRYEALNFKNEKTVEFRLFRGTLKYETILACLEFTFATWFFCRESSTKNLTIDHFLKFICANENRKDTKFLRTYLKSKGFTLPELQLLKKVA